MDIHNRERFDVVVINGETKWIEVDDMPPGTNLAPAPEMVDKGLHFLGIGTNGLMAVINTSSVVQKIEANALVGSVDLIARARRNRKDAA